MYMVIIVFQVSWSMGRGKTVAATTMQQLKQAVE